jgi:hypothetical protein
MCEDSPATELQLSGCNGSILGFLFLGGKFINTSKKMEKTRSTDILQVKS